MIESDDQLVSKKHLDYEFCLTVMCPNKCDVTNGLIILKAE